MASMDGNAAVPVLGGEDLIRGLPDLGEAVKVTGTSFRNVASASLSIDDIIALADRIDHCGTDIDGVIVTQGTDTIEETSFALELLVHRDIPVVMTGAMRNAGLPGADGPANLLHAVMTAASEEARGMGTLVVLNDEIHAARYVRKGHTQSPAAFQSAFGPIGWIAEGGAEFALKLQPLGCGPLAGVGPDVPVALLTASLGDDGRLLGKIGELGYGGLVIEALGGGHVPAAMVEPLAKLAREMPVVLASRTGKGKVLRNTYGYPGSETELFASGLISGGWLDGRKCRILLHLLLRSGAARTEIAENFHRFAGS